MALLAILVTARGAPVRRDRILRMLWGDSGLQQSRHLLSIMLLEVRRQLGDDVITATNDGVSLSRTSVRCDVIVFEDAIAAGSDADAIEAYDGPFLDGFHLPDSVEFEQWAAEERERLARLFSSLTSGHDHWSNCAPRR